MAGNRRSWSRGEPTPARPRSGPSRPARHHWAVVPAPARPLALPESPRRPRSRPVRGGKRRPGRIVPLRTRSRRHHNRAIMRKSSSTSDGPTRTILPERHNWEPGGAADRPGAPRDPVPTTTPAGAPGLVGRMRRMGLVGATTCPNLLQRHSTAGSAARRSAEYQRFFSGTPARSEPLQQIWTTAGTGLAGWTSVGHLPSGDDTPTAGTVAHRARRGVAGTTRSGGVVPAPDHHVTI